MIKTVALDPELFCQWDHHLVLRDKFAVSLGRLIADYPKREWKKTADKFITSLESTGVLQPVKAQTIRNWLSRFTGQPDPRFLRLRQTLPYDSSKSWASNADECVDAFDLVLSNRQLSSDHALAADNGLAYTSDPRFQSDTQRSIARTRDAIIGCVWPLVRISNSLRIIEPHFAPEPRFIRPFETLVERLREYESPVKLIELHVKRTQSFSQHTRRNYTNGIITSLPSGFQVKVYFWDDKADRLHARYLLTDRGGIKLDWGWDEGEQPTETTPADLLSHDRWQEEWSRYCVGSVAFDLDPSQHVLLIEG